MGDFPGSSDSQESACNAGDLGSTPEWGRSPGGGHGNLLQYSSVHGEFHGQRSLVDYSPWGGKESDTTECLTHYSDIILAASEGSGSSTSGLLKARVHSFTGH